MASITFWNRLEARPRSTDLEPGLAARVRDPFWFLARQWQFGEFRGEDAASPAYVSMTTRCANITGWRSGEGAEQSYTAKSPLERLSQHEPFSDDYARRVELGQLAEGVLGDAGLDSLNAALRHAYGVARRTEDELAAMTDLETARFLRVCGGRATDGVSLAAALAASADAVLDAIGVDPARRDAARAALAAFTDAVGADYGDLGAGDAEGWRPDRLEYDVDLAAARPSGGTVTLHATAEREGYLDWYAFDVTAEATTSAVTSTATSVSVLPAHVRFRGMPYPRFWRFEDAGSDYGAVTVDRRDVARLLVTDFMLTHGDDWFVVPLDQAIGTLCEVTSLVVRDVFGGDTTVERADHAGGTPGERWSMWSTTIEADSGRLATFFIMPPSVPSATLSGDALEEVRFLRDETANMVWGIEERAENGLGDPWRGHERSQAARPSSPPTAAPGIATTSDGLVYEIETSVPEHWIPFLAVALNTTQGAVALERAAMLRETDDGATEPVPPVGRVLQPASIGDAAYQIREEEVPRSGVVVRRRVRRARWIDGSTFLWVAREARIGAGPAGSGLRFDTAD